MSSRDTTRCPWKSLTRKRVNMLYSAFELKDYTSSYNFNVDQLTASQHKYALQLLRKHNSVGHLSKRYLRWMLQQSPNKSDRELARHVELLPTCNHCLKGQSRRKGHSKQSSETPAVPKRFMSDIVAERPQRPTDYFYSLWLLVLHAAGMFQN